MLTRLRPLLLLLAVAAPAAGLAACGGGGNDEDVNKVLEETFTGSKKVKSGKLNVAIGLEAKGIQGLSGPVSLKLTGPFQSTGEKKLPKFDLSVSFSGGGQSFSAGAVSTGDKGFLRFQGKTYEVGDQVFQQFKTAFEQAQQRSGGQKNPSLSSLGIDPRAWLKDPKNEGTEDAAGAKTIHVTAGIDVGKLLEDVNGLLAKAGSLGVAQGQRLPGRITAAQRSQIERAIKDARVEIFTGESDKILRRLVVDLDIEVPVDIRKDVGGLQSGSLKFTLEVADLNEDQAIAEPKGARPLSELLGSGLGGALGGSAGGGSGSSGSGSAPSGSAPSSKDISAYSACLQAAGSDLAKAQKCADLLTP